VRQWIRQSSRQKLATLNQAGSGDLHILGQKIADALPTRTRPRQRGFDRSCATELPRRSRTSPGGRSVLQRAEVRMLNVDVAQILANIVGPSIP
jgi:hypothetical protein